MKALAERTLLLLDNPALADRLGEDGRGRAQGRLDSQRMIDDILRTYHDVVAEARGRGSTGALASIEPVVKTRR
jgi:glycosyltransferase involved in cell wall biosynthesis